MAEPVVVAEFPQPVTGGVAAETTFLKYRTGYIIFAAHTTNPVVTVEVLAGEAGATVSGGYAKWARIPRPQRVSLTILEGYEPMTLSVPVLFDAVRENGVQEDCENQIQWLEWMAGRGIKNHKGFTVGVGKPALLTVFSCIGEDRNKESPLIPKQFQATKERGTEYLRWFIEDIAWDEHPLRSPGGARIRQAATVRLVQYVQDPVGKQAHKERYVTHHTTPSLNTLKKLVLHYLPRAKSPAERTEAWKVTLTENEKINRKIGHDANKTLKNHTPIRIANRFLTMT